MARESGWHVWPAIIRGPEQARIDIKSEMGPQPSAAEGRQGLQHLPSLQDEHGLREERVSMVQVVWRDRSNTGYVSYHHSTAARRLHTPHANIQHPHTATAAAAAAREMRVTAEKMVQPTERKPLRADSLRYRS